MFRSSASSSRNHLSPQQSLELANLYLGNANRSKDPELVLEWCSVTETELFRTKGASKKALSPLMQDDDRALREGMATALSNLGKLQDSLGQSEKAQASYRKAGQWGSGKVQERQDQHLSQTLQAKPKAESGSLNMSGSSSVTTSGNPGLDGDIATVPSHIFTENLNPPTIAFTPPEAEERLRDTPQLTCCLGLLRGSYTPDDILEPITRNWLTGIEHDVDEKERLRMLARDVVRAFKVEELKDSKMVAEVVYLAPVLEKDDFRYLLKELYSGIDESDLLEVHQLEGLAQLVQGADPDFLDADDLVKILGLLSTRLRGTHYQSSHHIHQLTLAISHVLDAMADTKVRDLEREKLHEPLSLYLDRLKKSSDPYLVYQAAYAFQALQHVPDNETLWQGTSRRTGKFIQGVSGLVSAAKGLDLNRFIEGLANVQQGFRGTSEMFGLVKTAFGDVTSLATSGQDFLDCLKESLSFERKRAWYPALRGADTLIRDGQLARFRKLVCEAPCRRDPAFQWGVCQQLGEIAANPVWDTDTRQGAIAFLGEVYQNDAVWGNQPNVKQWILSILMQLSSQTGGEQQHAEILLQELETNWGMEKQPFHEGGPYIPHLLNVNMLSLETTALLDRVQDKVDAEGTLRQLRKTRLYERRNAVYIPPQAKASLQSSDDARFPLMDKVKEFLDSDQTVFLLLGDSGAGKSTFTRELEYDLWKIYKKRNDAIPLYISLSGVDKPEHDMIAKQLLMSGFTEPQIRELKTYHKFVLICDGYDESQQTRNLYVSNRLNQPGEWVAQMVISCRSEYLGVDYRDRFQPGDRNQKSEPALYQEAVITPFSADQVQDYIKQYVNVHRPLWQTEDYQRALDLIPSLKELVKNPFLMTLSLEVLPRMVDPGQDLSDTHVTRVSLYDHFVEQWLERGKKRLGEKDLSPQARAAFESLSDEGFTLNGIDYLKKLSVAIYKEQGGQPMVEYSRFRDEGSWKAAFFSRDEEKYLLREASPLTRSGNQYRFIHRSLLEYGLALSIFDPQEWKESSVPKSIASAMSRRGSMSSIWSFEIEGGLQEDPTVAATEQQQQIVSSTSPLVWKSIVGEPSVLQFLEERVQQEAIFKQQLLGYIEHSKTDRKWRTAAANAITILVRAGIQFNGVDLQGIQIPGADISYGMFDSAQLQGADLRKTNLRGVWLRQANLNGALMTGAQFGELPMLEQTSDVKSMAYSRDGTSFAAGIRNGEITVYTTATWEKTWTLCGHTDTVESVDYSPNGDKIVSGSFDKTVRLWDVKTGTCYSVLRDHRDWIRCVAYSPQGDQFASASDDRTVRLWKAATGDCRLILAGHTKLVSCVMYSRKGSQVASSSMDYTIRLWDVETGDCSFVLSGHKDWVRVIAYSPQGGLVASGSDDRTIRLWDMETGACRQDLRGHTSLVVSIAFSPQGDRIVSGSKDGKLRLWDVESGSCLHTLTGHSKDINRVAYSPQGGLIASASTDSTVRLWDSETGVCLQVLTGHASLVLSVIFSPKGDRIVTGGLDKTVRLWVVEAGISRYASGGHSHGIVEIKCSPKGTQVASGSWGTTVRLWDAETGACRHLLRGHSKAITSIDFSVQGDLIVSGSWDRTVQLWDTSTGACRHVLTGHIDQINAVAFSPQGDLIASACDDNTARLWNVGSGDVNKILSGHTKQVLSVVFSPKGGQVATCSGDFTVRLWSVENGDCCHILIGHSGWVRNVVYSPQGDQVASASDDKTVRLWDAESGTCRLTLTGHRSNVDTITFSPKGDQVATGSKDETVRLWDVDTGNCRHILTGHSELIRSIAYSPQGDFLASAGNDKGVRLWEVGSGQCQAVIQNFHDRVNSITWSQMSGVNYLVTGCGEGSVRMWQVMSDESLYRVRLHWSSSNSLLAVTDASIQGVHGLSQANKQLLWQRGAVGNPVLHKQEIEQHVEQ